MNTKNFHRCPPPKVSRRNAMLLIPSFHQTPGMSFEKVLPSISRSSSFYFDWIMEQARFYLNRVLRYVSGRIQTLESVVLQHSKHYSCPLHYARLPRDPECVHAFTRRHFKLVRDLHLVRVLVEPSLGLVDQITLGTHFSVAATA